MSTPSHSTHAQPLSGWRARAWSWVLFVALFKGLISHAALASAVMTGNPALVWCAPGANSGAEAKASGAMTATAHDCVCAASADGTLPALRHSTPHPESALDQGRASSRQVTVSPARLLPPARGPPSL